MMQPLPIHGPLSLREKRGEKEPKREKEESTWSGVIDQSPLPSWREDIEIGG